MFERAIVLACCALGAAIAMISTFAPAIGEASIARAAVESIARQPECKGDITSTMVLGCALSETTGIYAFVISLLLLFAAPGIFMGYL